MIPEPLCKLLVVADSSCGVKRLWRAVYTLEDLLRSTPSSTPPSLPRAEGTAQPQHRFVPVFTLPGFWASPWTVPGVTWTHGGSHWLLLCLKKWGVNLLLSLTRLSLHKCLFAWAFYFSVFPPLHSQCQGTCLPGDVVCTCFCFQLSLFFFPHKHLRNAVACRDRTHFCIFSIVWMS